MPGAGVEAQPDLLPLSCVALLPLPIPNRAEFGGLWHLFRTPRDRGSVLSLPSVPDFSVRKAAKLVVKAGLG